jgi:hypothetical protein
MTCVAEEAIVQLLGLRITQLAQIGAFSPSAERPFLFKCVVFPRGARKTTQGIGRTMLPQAHSAKNAGHCVTPASEEKYPAAVG